MSTTRLALPEGYEPFLKDLNEQIRTAQVGAALAVNRELVLLYWRVGRDILTKQKQHGWGAKIIDRLAADLHKAFPEMTGLSPRNLKYMRALAEAYPNEQFVQQVVAQIPWGHNVRILDYVKSSTEREPERLEPERAGSPDREWPISSPGQSPDELQAHSAGSSVGARGACRQGPIQFRVLTLAEEARERELEQALIDHLRDSLLELGIGFLFVGSQYPIQVRGEEWNEGFLVHF